MPFSLYPAPPIARIPPWQGCSIFPSVPITRLPFDGVIPTEGKMLVGSGSIGERRRVLAYGMETRHLHGCCVTFKVVSSSSPRCGKGAGYEWDFERNGDFSTPWMMFPVTSLRIARLTADGI